MAAKKTAAKKPAVKNNATKVTTQPAPSKQSAADPSPLATPPRISIRMYRQGLGDCFLITFPVGPGRPFYHADRLWRCAGHARPCDAYEEGGRRHSSGDQQSDRPARGNP